jgi:two-component system, cell cycle sensor histidine kinase and response regulator CckA
LNTERIDELERLQRDLGRFQHVLEMISVNVWCGDALGENARVILGVDNLFGHSEVAVEQRLSAIHVDDLQRLLQVMAQSKESHSPFEVVVKVKDGKGGWVSLLITGRPVFDSAGVVLEWVGATTDITRQENAEARLRSQNDALQSSQNRLNLALTAAGMGVWEHDISSGQVTWSPEIPSILGVAGEQIDLEDFRALICPEDVSRNRPLIEQAIASGESFQTEFRLMLPDGSQRWLIDVGRASYDADGNPVRVLGTVQDVTRQKKSAEYLCCQNAVLRRIAAGDPIGDVLVAIVELCEGQLPNVLGALSIVDSNQRLQLAAGPRLPAALAASLSELPLRPIAEDSSESERLGLPTITSDLHTETAWAKHQALLRDLSLRSCWSFPILSSVQLKSPKPYRARASFRAPKTLGLLTLFRTQPGEPSAEDLEKIEQVLQLAAIALERQRSEAALLESERRFRELADLVPQLVWTTDAKGEFTYANQMLRSTLGKSVAADWPAVVHPDDRQRTTELFAESFRTGMPYAAEHRLRVQPSGEYRWFLARAVASRDDSGQVNGWYGVAADVDTLKNTESALREERDRLSAIASASPSILFSFACETDGRCYFPYIAPTMQSVFGVDPAILQQHAEPFLSRILPEDLAAGTRLMRTCQESLAPVHFGFRFRHPTKGTLWAEWEAAPTHSANGSLLWHGVLTDITQRKRLELRLAHTEKMEAIGRLAGGIAHDFNNLLTVILSSSHLLRMQVADRPDLLPNIEALLQAGERGSEMTRQLLTASRQQPASPQVVSLDATIRNSELLFRRLLGRDIRLVTSLEPQLNAVCIDPSQLEQVFINLLVNARDAMPAGGEVRITSRNRNVCPRTHPESIVGTPVSQDFVEIEVADSGHGMPHDVQDRIFDPFYTTKPSGKGTGLGLTVVHGIVTQNGGAIEVESRIGTGTTVRFLLPATRAPALQSPQAADCPLAEGRETILVVDDEPAISGICSRTLSSLGYHVLVAHSAHDAIRVFEEFAGQIDAVLTDVSMPEQTGVELAETLLGKYPQLKVGFMSGHIASRVGVPPALYEGPHFLAKPFTPRELSINIRRLIDGDN